MASELYGAPAGIDAADANARENLRSSLLAQKTLGEIEQQPAELDLKKAHARYYGGLADKEQAQAADLRTMQALEQSVAAARRNGVDLTAADVPAATAAKPKSMADPLIQLYNAGIAQGAPARILAPLAEKASLIQSHEATAASAQAAQVGHQLDAQQKLNELKGSFAQAALENPGSYDQLLMHAASMGVPPQMFPATFDPATMQGMVTESMKAKDNIELQRKKVHEQAQEARWRSSSAKDSAYVAKAKVATDIAKFNYDTLQKNGGKDSPDVVEARRALTQRRQQLNEATDRKEFPPAPLDPGARQLGQKYTAANGTKFMWTKDPASGKPVAMVVGGAKAVAPAAKVKDETDDEDEE